MTITRTLDIRAYSILIIYLAILLLVSAVTERRRAFAQGRVHPRRHKARELAASRGRQMGIGRRVWAYVHVYFLGMLTWLEMHPHPSFGNL